MYSWTHIALYGSNTCNCMSYLFGHWLFWISLYNHCQYYYYYYGCYDH